jgi:hypothetical protein
MREFIDDELEGRWCGEKIVGVWFVGCDRKTGETVLYVSWKREGREGWCELRHGIQKISFIGEFPARPILRVARKKDWALLRSWK